jgi:nitroimidazol reductase NimA-like FMN-containing flavoprotein (pyridoxamine 5'-phosphate oxidase superfamily)
MRRKEKEITEKAVLEEILLEKLVGRLGTSLNNTPYVVPMNYAYKAGKIYLHTHKDGKKVKDIQANPRVCFEVDDGEMIDAEDPCSFSWSYHSVIANGIARIITDPTEKLAALKIISNKYSFGKGDRLDLKTIEKYKDLWIIEISVDEMTGKKNPA